MSPSPQLSPPGSSTYDSSTLHVGDGTWDAGRDTFLLPPLMGVNFDTMRYNGMGNRFRNMPGYHSIIMAHGVIAALTFLLIVPAAIFFARFYWKNPRLALRIHIGLQILTVLLTTVVFALGMFAVGLPRSLTNPHHGIGVALYVMILFQAISGCLVHRREAKRLKSRISFQMMMHTWIGRVILLLGIAQMPLGLTLYGSPKALFILFAVWTFLLLVLFCVLAYRNRPSTGYDDGSSFVSGTRTDFTADTRSRTHRNKSRLGALAAVGAAGAGIAAARRSSRSRSRSRNRTDGHGTVISSRRGSRRHSASYYDDKYSEHQEGHTWRNRLLGAAAGAGAIAALKGLFGKKKDHRDGRSEVSSHYKPRPLGRPQSPSETDISRVEEGRVPASPGGTPAKDRWRRDNETEFTRTDFTRTDFTRTDLTPGPGRPSMGSPIRQSGRLPRRSGESIDSVTSDSRTDFSQPPKKGGNMARNALAAIGIAGLIGRFRGRKKSEDARVAEMREHEREEERITRMNSQRRKYTGDGNPPPKRPAGRRHSLDTATSFTSSSPSMSRHSLPRPAGSSSIPPPPLGAPSSRSTIVPVTTAGSIPPPPRIMSGDSDSELYTSAAGNRNRRNNRLGDAAVGAAAGAAVGAAAARRNNRPPRDPGSAVNYPSSGGESVASPPVSVKVKMHGDGRHVTLRRLNEEEAAAEREARKRDKQRRPRAGSLSSMSGTGAASGNDRWRRIEAMEAAQAASGIKGGPAIAPTASDLTATAPLSAPGPSSAAPPPIPPPPPGPAPPPVGGYGPPPPISRHDEDPYYPPPPPIPATMSGSVSYDTTTDVSNYGENRRRRRAERARAQQAAKNGSGSRVEFQ